jgi:DNA-directed RNA polymerase sigma subunit (sigma70/sigma32)
MTMNPNHVLEIPVLGGLSRRKRPARHDMQDKSDPHARPKRDRCPRDFDRHAAAPCRGYDASAGPLGFQNLLSVDEERELADRIKRGDAAARKQLILANLRLVISLVRRYRSRKLSFDDLVQEGNLGLIRASQDFDPSVHDTRFSTYAEIWINAFVYRALVANDSLIRVPEYVFELRKRYRCQ